MVNLSSWFNLLHSLTWFLLKVNFIFIVAIFCYAESFYCILFYFKKADSSHLRPDCIASRFFTWTHSVIVRPENQLAFGRVTWPWRSGPTRRTSCCLLKTSQCCFHSFALNSKLIPTSASSAFTSCHKGPWLVVSGESCWKWPGGHAGYLMQPLALWNAINVHRVHRKSRWFSL